jgi:uncharacterized protein YndB with AHSA1/START domain
MTTPRPAVLTEQEGRSALRFERSLTHPPEQGWRALTIHSELLHWHPTPFEFEPEVGGRVRFLPTPGAPEIPEGRVLAYDAPRRLAYTWGEDELRWELRPAPEGCLLSLTHLFDDRFKAARDGAGWHLCLESLVHCLEGLASEIRSEEKPPTAQWDELNADYQQRFGISPEQATPVPPH